MVRSWNLFKYVTGLAEGLRIEEIQKQYKGLYQKCPKALVEYNI